MTSANFLIQRCRRWVWHRVPPPRLEVSSIQAPRCIFCSVSLHRSLYAFRTWPVKGAIGVAVYSLAHVSKQQQSTHRSLGLVRIHIVTFLREQMRPSQATLSICSVFLSYVQRPLFSHYEFISPSIRWIRLEMARSHLAIA